MKYNICIPIENPQSNSPQFRYRMCNVYQTDDVDECVEELSGYLMDRFPANIEVKDTTDEEDTELMSKLAIMREEVQQALGKTVIETADSGKKS